MDELLMKKPSQLPDERREMFSLIDRFSSAVGEYRRQYSSLVEKRDRDLQRRSKEKESVLERLRIAQNEEQARSRKEHNAAISAIERQIADAQSQAAAAVEEQERRLANYVSREKASLDAAYNADESRLRGYREVRDGIAEVFSELEDAFGTDRFGRSNLNKVCDLSKVPKPDIKTSNEALKAVNASLVSEAESLFDDIADILNSLFKQLLFSGRIISYTETIFGMQNGAQAAVEWLEAQSRQEQLSRKKRYDDNCASKRRECSQNKQSILSQSEDAVKALRDRRSTMEREYQEASARMQSLHHSKYDGQERAFETQTANAAVEWQLELEKCNKAFEAKMEAEYPAERLNGWMQKFWDHPRNVEEYGKAQSIQLNTLIGMAMVDISDWYGGETGAVVRKVLTKYRFLFGPDRNSARKAYHEAKMNLPYSLSIEEGTSMLLSYEDAAEERAKAIINAIGMRLLRSVPACQMRFQLIDADGIGAFGNLMALDPAAGNNPGEPTVKSFAIGEGGKVHSTSSDIAAQIAETKVTMDDLSRQLTEYASIREFNEDHPLSKQIYRPILMMNFPLGLGQDELRTLNAMVSVCSKWGFSMVLAQPDKALQALKPELQPLVNELQGHLLCLRMVGNQRGLKVMRTHSQTEKKAEILFYGLPDNALIPGIAEEIRKECVAASSVLVQFTRAKGVCPEKAEWFKEKADDGIAIPVGYLEGGQPFKLQFDDRHVHAVIMGNTGSGKTNLLHVLMANTMLRYSPDEVMIYLIDFKYGLDFRMYTWYNLPNFRTISINNDPEFALAMLQNLEKEQQERSTRMGSRYQKISEYNAANPGERLPRIMLIIDELYELAKRASDTVQKSILKKIDSFAHQTRAFGIHMVICGQDLDKIDNFETIKNQCATRVALRCGDEQVKMLMDEAGVTRMHTIDANDQGSCVFSVSGGSNPQTEHTAYLGAEQQARVLGAIHKHYWDAKRITNVKVLLTRVSDNPNHPLQRFVSKGSIPDRDRYRLMVGEPISMERELNLCPSGNVWVAGGMGSANPDSMEAGNSILFYSAVSLMMAKIKDGKTAMLCTNCCDQPTRDREDAQKDYLGQLAFTQRQFFQYHTGAAIKTVLNALLDELEKRKDKKASSEKAIWWFLVRPELADGGMDGSLIIDLKELLQHGPKFNIHTILWNADIKRAQKMQMDRTLFEDRICLEMTPEEAKIVNGSDIKQMPEGYKAVLTGKNTIRFRVYDLPDGKWMDSLFERLELITHPQK